MTDNPGDRQDVLNEIGPNELGREDMAAVEIVIDARGRRCPVPTLRLRRAWESAPPGAMLRVLADDPMARIDLPHFAAQVGLGLIRLDVSGVSVTALFRKPPA